MVSGVSTGSPVGVISMTALRYAQPAAAEPVMPVRPAQLVNATFRHIRVQPDSRLESGIPIYKLKILDTLIDHLAPRQAAGRMGTRADQRMDIRVDAGSIDSIIMAMSRGMSGAYRSGTLPAPGAVVDLLA